jgi:predicted acyl esterase
MINSQCKTVLVIIAIMSISSFVRAQTLPSERPEKIEPTYDGFDYTRREVMIPMRDGVKLHTVILVPKGCEECANSFNSHAI